VPVIIRGETIVKELPIAACRLCGEEFRQKRNDQRFCETACRKKYHRNIEQRGGRAVEMLIEWRNSRGSKKGALTKIAALVDSWIREDRK